MSWSWLLPKAVLPAAATVRTVGELNEEQREAARKRLAAQRHQRWRLSEKGRAYAVRNRERLNATARERYRTDEKRREYIRRKTAEQRANPAFRDHLNARRRELRAQRKLLAITTNGKAR